MFTEADLEEAVEEVLGGISGGIEDFKGIRGRIADVDVAGEGGWLGGGGGGCDEGVGGGGWGCDGGGGGGRAPGKGG